MTPYTLGIDLGGTNVKTVAVTALGEVLHQDHFGTVDDSAATWFKTIRIFVERTERELGKAEKIGVASPGLASRDGRSIAWMRGRLASVEALDWTDQLQRDQSVIVLNDAHAALLGEAWCGAAVGKRNVVMLTLGTGVGGAIMCDGRLLTGHIGRAGHLGHISLNPDGAKDIVNTPGSLEEAIGECTLQKRCNGKFATTKELVEAHRAGDSSATECWTKSVKALAAGIVSIANAVDPEIFVLGGGIALAGEVLTVPLQTYLTEFEWRPFGEGMPIVMAKLGDRAGALGAAKRAWEMVQQ